MRESDLSMRFPHANRYLPRHQSAGQLSLENALADRR
jgi:hypothetical protein